MIDKIKELLLKTEPDQFVHWVKESQLAKDFQYELNETLGVSRTNEIIKEQEHGKY